MIIPENILQYPIVDLHCDLLTYLSRDAKRTPFDREVRCSIPQLREGNVKIQTMAIFSETHPRSSEAGWLQADVFRQLLQKHPDDFRLIRKGNSIVDLKDSKKIGIIAAIESMSAICSEEDNLEKQLEKFAALQKKIGKVLYVSLTWNTENRFGGGALTGGGLKEDGRRVVDFLCEHGIALDLSHASDRLAYDLLNDIDRRGLKISVIASHSNMRAIANFPRNLPDDIVKEIVRRGGVIGLNFIRYLLGRESPNFFAKHLDHLLLLGGAKSVCFGADFFYPGDVPLGKPVEELFFSAFDNASAYTHILELLKSQLSLPHEVLEDLCYNNALNFIS